LIDNKVDLNLNLIMEILCLFPYLFFPKLSLLGHKNEYQRASDQVRREDVKEFKGLVHFSKNFCW